MRRIQRMRFQDLDHSEKRARDVARGCKVPEPQLGAFGHEEAGANKTVGYRVSCELP